ncbi:acyltransferase family protein [Acidianus ambivalens]|uniref:Acyltransferase family protein n=1 Tax=Acidianus ambivalens TaxID=2283 RepID=A0A650CTW4_ACIAM|nr:acyltransferase [Acidianus ambivalens]MQL56164.1 acyltransferase family protein [Acidianus ambivalens]QGR21294.1 acyltransferase family protein [Acidianus ambivalens]
MKYDPRLSQLRFFAAFSVALYHLWTLQIIPLVFFRPGWLGVPLFFELSIYLLLNRLDDNPSIKRYFKRRIKRIWPLYFMAVVSVFFADKYVLHLDVTYYDLILHFAFVSFAFTPFSFQYLFWSLQLEEWMYLVIPFIHMVDDKTKFRIGVTFTLVSLFYSLFIVFLPYDEFHLLYFMPPYWLGAYGWGIIAYLLQKKNYRPNSNIHYIIIGLILLQYVFVALYVKTEFVYEFYTKFALYNLILPFFALMIIKPPVIINKATVFLGEVSYGIYLWTLLFQELFGAIGIIYGILAAIATEFPLRRRETIRRLESIHYL